MFKILVQRSYIGTLREMARKHQFFNIAIPVLALACLISCTNTDDEMPSPVEAVPVTSNGSVTTVSNGDVEDSILVATSVAVQSTEPSSAEANPIDVADSADTKEAVEVTPPTIAPTTTEQSLTTTTVPYQVQTYEPNETPSGPFTYEPSA